MMRKLLGSTAIGAALLFAGGWQPVLADAHNPFGRQAVHHVLLISIDGMHAVDFINCANGISGVNGGLRIVPISPN
jgi:hypothetical protein